MRRVAFEQGAIDAIFFERVFEFLEECRFDLACDPGKHFHPRHDQAWLKWLGWTRNYLAVNGSPIGNLAAFDGGKREPFTSLKPGILPHGAGQVRLNRK